MTDTDLRFPNQDLRNKDFKDLAAGDETHRYGDYIPRVAAEELTVGDLFALNAEGEAVAYGGGDADDLAGVVYSNVNDDTGPGNVEEDAVVEAEEAFTAKVQGTVIAAVPADPATDSFYDTLAPGRGPSGELLLDVSEEDDFVHLLLP